MCVCVCVYIYIYSLKCGVRGYLASENRDFPINFGHSQQGDTHIFWEREVLKKLGKCNSHHLVNGLSAFPRSSSYLMVFKTLK